MKTRIVAALLMTAMFAAPSYALTPVSAPVAPPVVLVGQTSPLTFVGTAVGTVDANTALATAITLTGTLGYDAKGVEQYIGVTALTSQLGLFDLGTFTGNLFSFTQNGKILNFTLDSSRPPATPAGLRGSFTGVDSLGTSRVFDLTGGVGNITLAAPSGVPEPAIWAMMLMGFGMIGAGLRSRRKANVRVNYA